MTPRVHVGSPYTSVLLPRFLDVIDEPGRKFVALSGGRTPREFFALLATEFRDRVPWERLAIFQVDERCVPPDHAESNWRQIQETILEVAPRVEAHRMRAEEADAAEAYEAVLERTLPKNESGVPVFDVALLGLGPDGHTASLFPGTAALDETRRFVVRNAVPQLDTERITLTYPVLNAARHRWFLLRGADRRTIFAETQAGHHPAGRIRDPEWFVEPDVLG